MMIIEKEKNNKITNYKSKLVYKRVILRLLKHSNYESYMDKL